MSVDEVEAVAQAFYATLDNARGWQRKPELLKQAFRRDARIAIAAINEHRGIDSSREIGSLVIAADLQQARDFLMTSPEVSVLPRSRFRAVLRGPDHIFDGANESHSKLIGFRDVIGRPVRAALPELSGQGYFELLDNVYTTKRPFLGYILPVIYQPTPRSGLEEHIIDLLYRPIEDAAGHVTGIFVEGFDRTEWARA